MWTFQSHSIPGPNFIKMCLPGVHQLVHSGRHILFFIKLDYRKGINYGWVDALPAELMPLPEDSGVCMSCGKAPVGAFREGTFYKLGPSLLYRVARGGGLILKLCRSFHYCSSYKTLFSCSRKQNNILSEFLLRVMLIVEKLCYYSRGVNFWVRKSVESAQLSSAYRARFPSPSAPLSRANFKLLLKILHHWVY